MINCKNKEAVLRSFLNVYIRETRVSFKRYDGDTFIKSVIIPTSKYPLKTDDIAVFTADNTELITEQQYIDIINQMPYEIGRCYTNTERIAKAFLENGIHTFKPYVGWLFIGIKDLPVHHCWGVLDDKYLIDLSDDFDTLYGLNGHMFDGLSPDECRVQYLDYMKEALKQPHSVRCNPLGKASRLCFYVGCECSPEDGNKFFWDLMKKYPKHESYISTDTSGATPLQQQLRENKLTKF